MAISSQSIISLIVVLSVTVADMSTDLYSVALSHIADYFNVDGNIVQFTLTCNLTGIALSGLIYGPLSDYYGRRPIMLVGMAIFTIASCICCIADDIILLILARFLQGIGSGVASVIGYATIRDMYSGIEYSKVISKLNMVVALSPCIAPVVGSHIIKWGCNWRFLFFIIFLTTTIMFCLIYFKLKETLIIKHNKASINHIIIRILKQYLLLFRNYRFLGFAVIQGLTFMWLWAYIANYPFIFKYLKIKDEYFGYLISIMVSFYMIGALINRKYVSKIGINKMLTIGLILPIISDGSLLIYYYSIGHLNLYILEIAWILSNIGIAFIISNNVTLAFGEINDIGFGSAFISFCDMAFGATGIYIVGKFFHYNVLPNLVLTVICSITAIVIYSLLHMAKYTNNQLKI
ncbi:bicyclomycin resistance protein [Wolbachia pipientis]|uniref:Bcr/CflA family efflux transporter n=1 Tax=Wolbachia pipientis TaxID=955 RepID=A0A1E7QJZ6_WOLPI|nr:multidrug effflux MFS transporter [Wolbachia pipientis]OEY86549.1 bicyclomycin resistance protein [Wolbachia pipientis]